MKISIKDLKEKGEKDDKIKFTAKVKNVYDAKELTPEQKAKAKYTFSRQNIVVEDGTDNIKIIISQKIKEDEYTKDIIGKEVEVDGKLSIWEGKKNIFGKITFKEGEEPKKITTNVSNQIKPATSALPPIVEIRKMSLKLAVDFWGSRIGHEKDEKGVIKTAGLFKEYLLGKAEETTQRKQKQEEPKEEAKPEEKKELNAEKIALINSIMNLKEEKHLNTDTFAHYCNGKNVKELSIEELEKIKKQLEGLTEEIPF